MPPTACLIAFAAMLRDDAGALPQAIRIIADRIAATVAAETTPAPLRLRPIGDELKRRMI
jgi:hypothetical protein